MQIQVSVSPMARVQAWLRVTVLALFSGYFGYNVLTGQIANYINVRFIWLTYVAVLIFVLMTVSAVFRALNPAPDAYSISESRRLTWPLLFVAALPLTFGILFPSQPLGADAVNGSISTRTVLGVNEAAFNVAPENRNVLDWLRVFAETNDFTKFDGQPVDVVGFIYREPSFESDAFMVARFTISCCVADASALGLPAVFPDADSYADGDWVHVTGRMLTAPFDGDELPVIQVQSVTPIDVPDEPYLYP
jgi:uncharacterized repeat protein (TIGR03943 family)